MQGLETVAVRPADLDEKKYGIGLFRLSGTPPPTVRLVGRWMKESLPDNTVNPIEARRPPDYVGPALACLPPDGSPFSGYALLLEAFGEKRNDKDRDFFLAFYGGFSVGSRDHTKPMTFLGMIYPVEDQDHLPSIDWQAGAPAPPDRDPRKTPTKKVGRNEKCPCGSGKKFKRCHGR